MPKKYKPSIAKPYPEPKIKVPRFSEEAGFYTTKQRSFNMARIKGKDTKAEKLLKKALWHAGVRYRSNKQKLPGKPDISLIKYKLVIFVDGAFWHGYDWENRKSTIKSNQDFWIPKIERNRQRDREINHYYRSKGWTVLRFWDFEVKQELGSCVKRVWMYWFCPYNQKSIDLNMGNLNQKTTLFPILDLQEFQANNLEGLCILDHSIQGKHIIETPHKHDFFGIQTLTFYQQYLS